MLFSKDVLFIHVPRTGGTSVRLFLSQILPPPVYYTFPTPPLGRQIPGLVWIAGVQHETLVEARDVLRGCGRDLDQFPLILATIRNPYELEVSRYGFYNSGMGLPTDPNVRQAFEEDFQAFACQNTEYSGARALEHYYRLDGRVPPNLRIMRFEKLEEDLREALREIGIESDVEFPHENESTHSAFERYYADSSEQAVYSRNKWVFDSGWYERLHPHNSVAEIAKQELRDLKQALRDQRVKQKRLLEAYNTNERWLQQLETAVNDLERTAHWAHDLESIARQQQATIHTYQRWLGPLLPFVRLARKVKTRLAPQRSG